MKDWLNDIQNKLGDFEMKAPDGLWGRISAGLPASKEASPYFAVGNWFKRAGFATAAFAAIIIAVVFIFHSSEEHPGKPIENFLADVHTEVQVDTSPQNGEQSRSGLQESNVKPSVSAPNKMDSQTGAVDGAAVESNAAEDRQPHNAEIQPSTVNSQLPDNSDRGQTEWYDVRIDNSSQRPVDRRWGKVSIGIANSYGAQTSNVLAYGGTEIASADMPGNGVIDVGESMQDAAWDESPLLGMLLLGRGAEEVKFTHYMPMRIGITVDLQLSERCFVESGVIYTRLMSDIRHGNESFSVSSRQILDYVGIPLNVKFKAFGTPRFSLYASTGMNLDKCVSAKRIGSYEINGEFNHGSLGTEICDERPLQFSANVALGVAYHISPLVSIYAEPGTSWYFDDGSSFSTIYKERPLNFSMNLGLRFTFSNN